MLKETEPYIRPVARVQILFAVLDIREWKGFGLDKRGVVCAFLPGEGGREASQGSAKGGKANDVRMTGEPERDCVCRDGVDIAVVGNEGGMSYSSLKLIEDKDRKGASLSGAVETAASSAIPRNSTLTPNPSSFQVNSMPSKSSKITLQLTSWMETSRAIEG